MAQLSVDSRLRKYISASPKVFSSAKQDSNDVAKALRAAGAVCRAALTSLPHFTEEVLTAAKEITSASWAELLLLQGSTLVVCPSGKDAQMRQAHQRIQVTNESLVGLVALTGEIKNFTSPHATAYKSSAQKLTPFSLTTKQPEETWSVAAFPIFDSDGSRSGVLVIFNKSEENHPQSFFTSLDLTLCKELCEVVGAALETRKAAESTKNQLQSFQDFLGERSNVMNTFVDAFGKKKRLKQLCKTMVKASELTAGLLRALMDVLQFDGLIVHICHGSTLEPQMALGITLPDYRTNSASFCAFTTHEPLIVVDIATEPLLAGLNLPMKGALCYPVLKPDGPIAVFELFRRDATFSELDITLFKRVEEAIGHISTRHYHRLIDSEKQAKNDPISRFLREFSLPRKGEIFDYVSLLKATESSVKRLFRSTSCSIYITDETRRLIWTRKSDSCDPLTFMIEEQSLLGLLARKQSITLFPLDEKLLELEGADTYAKAKGACTPILGSFMGSEHVLGVILLTRDSGLSQLELLQLQLLADTVSRCLLLLYFDTRYVRGIETAESNGLMRGQSFIEVNLEERVLIRARTDSIGFGVSSDSKGPQPPLVKLLRNMAFIPSVTFQAVSALCRALETEEEPLQLIASELKRLLPCEAARLLLFDHAHQYLIDKFTGEQILPIGLIKVALTSNSILSEGANVMFRREFEAEVDGCGIEEVESLVIVPILCQSSQPEGVLQFVNVRDADRTVGITAELLACIPRDILISKYDSGKNWRDLVQTGRRKKMLFKWCSELFRVLILSQQRTLKCSSILNRLRMSPDLTDLMTIALETLTLIVNAEGAKLIIRGAAKYLQFTREGGLEQTVLQGLEEQVFDRGTPSVKCADESLHNSYLLPVRLDQRVVAIVKLWNKKDESLNSYVSFGDSDEAVTKEICDQLGAACQALVEGGKEQWFPDLTATLQERAWAITNYGLLSTIRQACKALLNCDRASVFIVEGDRVVIKPQGNDHEVPAGTTVHVGVGIVGSVVQTGQAAILEDVYQDARFNPSVDMKTGYRTRTMLCAPVVAQGRVIAALQMINKSNGLFDSVDLEILTMLSDMAAGVLQSMQLFQLVIDEKKMYTDMLNGLGCAIVMLKDGMLDFSNRSIEALLGVSEAFAVSHSYTQWSSLSQTLRSDIDGVHENLLKTAKKRFQIIQNNERDQRHYDYRIIPVDEDGVFQKKVMLVFEEVSVKNTLTGQRRQQRQLSMQPLTILQTCIHQLSEMMEKTSPELKPTLDFVVHTLKSGNLNQTKIIVNEEGIVDSINPEILQCVSEISQPKKRRTTDFSLDVPGEPSTSTVSLQELRDWNLDFAKVSSEYPYIVGMLEDCNLMKDFNIDITVFQNFVSEIKMYYNQRKNPFHNYMHACSVMHNMYCMLVSTAAGRLYDDWELLGLLIGALCHDVDHTGRSNSFEISRESPLAIRYHDTSVLEQHHAATLFHTLQKANCNFLAAVDRAIMKNIRKFMISIILSTDLAKHMNMVANMQARFKELGEEPLGSRPNDNREVGELLIHCADLSNPTKPFSIAYEWSVYLSKEFEAQVHEEIALNLPVTTFMQDLHKPAVFLKNEINFYSVVVKPLWECIGEWLSPAIDLRIAQINENIDILKQMLEDENRTSTAGLQLNRD